VDRTLGAGDAETRSMMRVSTERYEGLPLVVVSGEIDHGSSGALQTKIDAVLEDGSRIVLLDLVDVTYIDSGGISVLLSAVRRLRNEGWLAAIGPNPNVRRLFEIVGLKFDAGFRVFDDRAQAAGAAGGVT
jgi:anti-sigma B factor antagonist